MSDEPALTIVPTSVALPLRPVRGWRRSLAGLRSRPRRARVRRPLPSATVVGAGYAVVAACTVSGSTPVAAGAALAAPVVFGVYARMRATRRQDVFLVAMAPFAVTAVLHDLVGAPRWAAWLIVPVALAALVAGDRAEAGARASVR